MLDPLRWLILVAAFAAVSGACVGQGVGDRTYYPEELREDLELLRTTIHEAHADPYRYVSRAELDRLFDRLRDGLGTTLSVSSFIDSVEVVLRAIGDGHTSCELPLEDAARLERRIPIMPMELSVIDGGLYVRRDKMDFRSIAPGSRVLSIDGIAAEEIIRTLMDEAICDGRSKNGALRLVENDFAILHGMRFGFRTEHKLVCENVHGVLEQVVVHSLTGEEMAATRPSQEELLPWRVTFHEDRSLAWVEMKTLDAMALADADQRPEKFLGELLRELEKKEVGILVLDLRGAAGVDLGMAEQVFALVAQKPFRVVQSMAVRSITVPTWYRRAVPLDDFYASAGGRFALEEAGLYVLHPNDERLKDLPASYRRFEGGVYVLQDGLTREAAAAVGILAKRSGRGKLLGEEAGTNSFSYCGGRELLITAPNTGVRFTVPLIRYVFDGAASGPNELGELPDITLQPDAGSLVTGEDGIRKAALTVIEGLR